MSKLILYDNLLSGHAHRPRTLLKILNVDFETVIVDFAKGEHKQDDFLKINPLGQIPAFVDDDVVFRDSTSILVYLALSFDNDRTWLPEEPKLAAQVQGWLAVSTKEIYDGPCLARIHKLFGMPCDYSAVVEKTDKVLKALFEVRLEKNDWLVGSQPTIADIANYGYIAAAPEGGIDLSKYPHTQGWLSRLETLSGFDPMPKAADIISDKD